MKFSVMSMDDVISAVSAIRGGSMARITYYSELPVKAEMKKSGVAIYKVTELTARFGVDYSNIGSVVAMRSANDYVAPAKKANNSEWVIRNRVSYNTKTGKTSVRFAKMNSGSNKKVVYIMETPNGTSVIGNHIPESIMQNVQDSYWKKNSPAVQNISADHIISIHNKRIGGESIWVKF